jgi:GTPase SAR1 family protein
MIRDPNKFTLATKEDVSQLLQRDYLPSLFKISLLGDQGVGLSTFRDYYLRGSDSSWKNYRNAVGCETGSKQMSVLGLNVKLQWWIISLKFHFSISAYLRGSSLILIFYDITSKTSITTLEKIMNLVQDQTAVPLILVGNKCDLLKYREVSTEEVINSEYMKDIAVYIEISAETILVSTSSRNYPCSRNFGISISHRSTRGYRSSRPNNYRLFVVGRSHDQSRGKFCLNLFGRQTL